MVVRVQLDARIHETLRARARITGRDLSEAATEALRVGLERLQRKVRIDAHTCSFRESRESEMVLDLMALNRRYAALNYEASELFRDVTTALIRFDGLSHKFKLLAGLRGTAGPNVPLAEIPDINLLYERYVFKKRSETKAAGEQKP